MYLWLPLHGPGMLPKKWEQVQCEDIGNRQVPHYSKCDTCKDRERKKISKMKAISTMLLLNGTFNKNPSKLIAI